jgi:hypothetical protein
MYSNHNLVNGGLNNPPLNLLLYIIPMDIKIKKNKDGSITKVITTVEEVTISVEEIEAEVQ